MIETARLTLTLHTAADLAALHAMWGDPAVVRHIGGHIGTQQDSWFRLLRYRGLWDVLGYGYWCVRTRHDDRYVGDVGFADFHRPVTPPLGDTPEAGWVLAPWAHGQGFATEALRAALDWMDRIRAIERTVCLVDPDNAGSLRVAEKCGYLRDGFVVMGEDRAVRLVRLADR